jgi:hypothetical protein
MPEINISNSKGRDAVVATQSVRNAQVIRWLDEESRQASTVRLLKATLDRDIRALEKSAGGLDKVAAALLAGDPEVDIENYGRALRETTRVHINPDGALCHRVKQFEVVRNVDGAERERRPRRAAQPNTATETPLKWSGRLMKKSDVYNKFVFSGKQQIVHVNGLTYDFLYGMAKELEEKDSLLFVGAGAKSNQPLVFMRGGTGYRGFLEGRTQGDKYCLILHLSNMELKAPAALPAPEEAKA